MMPPPPSTFPLRWESTGDQWWFASPIDWAAANGHYDVVRELLHIDTNLLIKLTSLPRIRRLETVWDDQHSFSHAAECRAQVAHKLFLECHNKGGNSLIRAGYGGWLLYTAAAAGDALFVNELLDRDPLLVFGEGEYGVTDILYAAARSKNSAVFRLLFDNCVSPRGIGKEVSLGFRSEMMNRAVHAAARGGHLEMLTELFADGGDALAYRDGRGSTVLHSAAGRGQLKVVEHLISSYEIINSVDNRGNTALHIAAYRGHLSTVEFLTSTSPSLALLQNNYGDTFLHMAVSGFLAPGFKRLDRQLHLMKQLVDGVLVEMEDIVNIKNNEGRTALHMAVTENIQSNVVELLMSVRYIDLNVRDAGGNTPLDILKQRPRSPSSEVLIKRLISAGGISNCRDRMTRTALVSHRRRHGIGGSPGTSFRIPDAEIFLYTGVENAGPSSCDLTSSEYGYSGEIKAESNSSKYNKLASINSATKRFKNLLRFPGKIKQRNVDESDFEDDCSIGSYTTGSTSKNSPIPLRQQFSRDSSLPNNKRVQALQGNYPPSPSTKKQFAAGLSQGVLRVLPRTYFGSPSSGFSDQSSDGTKSVNQSPKLDSLKMKRKNGSFNLRLLNSYFCFGAEGLAVDKPINSSSHSLRNSR